MITNILEELADTFILTVLPWLVTVHKATWYHNPEYHSLKNMFYYYLHHAFISHTHTHTQKRNCKVNQQYATTQMDKLCRLPQSTFFSERKELSAFLVFKPLTLSLIFKTNICLPIPCLPA
jgi:4-amino-4-deoxy-L-arabinose transferase-like glycosyltransferase